MRKTLRIELNEDTREEQLPEFTPEFPYLASCCLFDEYLGPVGPWHWHRAMELFFIESGTLEYTTPKGKWVFPAGSGGLVNSNVLHASRLLTTQCSNIQLLHLFDVSFIAGTHGSRMEEKYILPLTAAPGLELIPLHPEDPEQARILQEVRQAFDLDEDAWGYEFDLRDRLTRIWLSLFELARPAMDSRPGDHTADDKVKAMMIYIHEHFQDPISVDQLAQTVHISKRACFRLFQEHLHMTPVEYMRSYRLQRACQMLANGTESITQIAYNCGLGSSSYFGKVFRERFGCSPAQYRSKWHDRDISGHK